MLDLLAGLVVRRPALILVSSVLGVLVFGFFAPQQVQTSGNEAFAPDTPELAALEAENELFGAAADVYVQIILGGEPGDDVVSPQGLNDVRAIHEGIRRDAPATLLTDDPSRPTILSWFGPVEEALVLMGREGETPEADELDQIAIQSMAGLPGQVAAQIGQLTSSDDPKDSRSGIILVRLDRSTILSSQPSLGESDAIILAQNQIIDLVRGIPTGLRTQPFALDVLLSPDADFQREVGRLFALAFGAIALILLFVFRLARNGGRSFRAAIRRSGADALLALGVAFLAILFQVGAGVLLGPDFLGVIGYFSPPAQIVPVLLVALGVDYAIHMQERYRDELAVLGPDQATRQAITRVGPALALASITTAIGFLTNVVSPTPAIADLGVLAALGLLAAFILAVTFFPAARLLLDRRALRRQTLPTPVDVERGGDLLADVGAWFAGPALRQPLALLAIAGVLAAGGGYGLSQLETAYDFSDFVPEDSPLLAAFTALQEDFGGGVDQRTSVLLRGPGVATPAVHNAMVELERQLPTIPQVAVVDGLPVVTSFAGVVGPVLRMSASDMRSTDAPPGSPEGGLGATPPTGQVLQALARANAAGFQQADGTIAADGDVTAVYDALRSIAPGLDGVATRNGAGELVAVRLQVSTPIADAATEVPQMLQAFEPLVDDVVAAGEVTVDVVSQAIVQDVSIRLLSDSQLRAILITLISVTLLLIAWYSVRQRRPVLGGLLIIPVVCTVLWTFGAMHLLGLDFDPVTSIISSLVVGIGIDYVIHLGERFTQDLGERASIAEAMTATLTHTGGALTGSAVTTVVGFAMLTTASLPPFVRLGTIIVLAIGLSLLSSLVVGAPILVLWARAQARRSGATVDGPVLVLEPSGAAQVAEGRGRSGFPAPTGAGAGLPAPTGAGAGLPAPTGAGAGLPAQTPRGAWAPPAVRPHRAEPAGTVAGSTWAPPVPRPPARDRTRPPVVPGPPST